MARIEDLADRYGRHIATPWQRTVAGAQRVVMLVYDKELERTLRARKLAFETATRDLIAQRAPTWTLVERLAKHAAATPEAKAHLDQIAAIRNQRLLLEKSDPANAIRVALAGLLRDAFQKGHAAHDTAFNAAMASLAANSVWTKVTPADQESIKGAVGLQAPVKADITSDDALAGHLDWKPLSSIQAEIDAIAGRVALAIERAARLLEPKVQTVTLERSTLRDAVEVEAWIERQKTTLLSKIANGPVLVN